MAFRARSFDIFLFSPLDLDQPSPPEGKTTSLFLLNSVVIGFRLVPATCSVWRRREEKVSGERERGEEKDEMEESSERASETPTSPCDNAFSLSLSRPPSSSLPTTETKQKKQDKEALEGGGRRGDRPAEADHSSRAETER